MLVKVTLTEVPNNSNKVSCTSLVLQQSCSEYTISLSQQSCSVLEHVVDLLDSEAVKLLLDGHQVHTLQVDVLTGGPLQVSLPCGELRVEPILLSVSWVDRGINALEMPRPWFLKAEDIYLLLKSIALKLKNNTLQFPLVTRTVQLLSDSLPASVGKQLNTEECFQTIHLLDDLIEVQLLKCDAGIDSARFSLAMALLSLRKRVFGLLKEVEQSKEVFVRQQKEKVLDLYSKSVTSATDYKKNVMTSLSVKPVLESSLAVTAQPYVSYMLHSVVLPLVSRATDIAQARLPERVTALTSEVIKDTAVLVNSNVPPEVLSQAAQALSDMAEYCGIDSSPVVVVVA